MAYTREELVEAELNGYAINTTTNPSSNELVFWLDEIDKEIDERTGEVWNSQIASSIILDYDGNGMLQLPNRPVLSITELKYETKGLGANQTTWSTSTEGRTEDFILYSDEGEVKFFGTNKPTAGYQNVCVSYTHGRSSIPKLVQRLATLLAARRVINAAVNKASTEADGSVTAGTITVSDPTTFSIERVKAMNEEIKSIFQLLGSGLKTHVPRRRYD